MTKKKSAPAAKKAKKTSNAVAPVTKSATKVVVMPAVKEETAAQKQAKSAGKPQSQKDSEALAASFVDNPKFQGISADNGPVLLHGKPLKTESELLQHLTNHAPTIDAAVNGTYETLPTVAAIYAAVRPVLRIAAHQASGTSSQPLEAFLKVLDFNFPGAADY